MSYLNRFRKEKEPTRSELIATRVTKEMREEFEQLCVSLNLSMSEGLFYLIERELKELKDQREPREQPQPIKKERTKRFITVRYQIDNKLPCPVCGVWVSVANYARHARQQHDMTTQELITSDLDKVQEMVREEGGR